MSDIRPISVSTATGTGVVTTDLKYLHFLEWHPGAGGQSLIVKDNSGAVLYKVQSAGAATNGESAYVEWKEFEGVINGLTVDTIGGGTLYIHLG